MTILSGSSEAFRHFRYVMGENLVTLFAFVLFFAFVFVALFGGYFVGVYMFGLAEGSYMNGMIDSIEWVDVRLGLVKSLIFGLLITLICCARGFYMHLGKAGSQGAEGVSSVTTDAVVLSSIAVLFSDFLIGALV